MTVINTNTSALRAQNGSRVANMALQVAMERLSTGKRINSAKDDAAGLAIASSMTSQIRGMSQAIRNSNDGISFAQTAEGALSEVTNMLLEERIPTVFLRAAEIRGQSEPLKIYTPAALHDEHASGASATP